jgi:hypothetical protein
MNIRELIEDCRRQQDERDRMLGFHEWATEEETLEQWRNETLDEFQLST